MLKHYYNFFLFSVDLQLTILLSEDASSSAQLSPAPMTETLDLAYASQVHVDTVLPFYFRPKISYGFCCLNKLLGDLLEDIGSIKQHNYISQLFLWIFLAAQAEITCQIFEIQQKLEPLHIWRHNHDWKGRKTKQLFAKIHSCLILFNIIDESLQALPTETPPDTAPTFLQTAEAGESLNSVWAYSR